MRPTDPDPRGLVLVVEDDRGHRRPRPALPAHARASACTSRPTARPRSPPSAGCTPSRSSSTSGCPGMDGDRGVPPDAGGGRLDAGRCSSPPATTRSTGSSASSWAPTTTSPSRSARASWSPGSGRCCAGRAGRPGREEVLAMGPVRVQVDRRRVHVGDREVAADRHRVRPARAPHARARRGCSPGSSCSARSGATRPRPAPARSTSTSPSCAPSSVTASPIRTVRGTGYAAEYR